MPDSTMVSIAIAGQLLDLATTMHILEQGGAELNPIIYIGLDNYSTFIAGKLLLCVILYMYRHNIGLPEVVLSWLPVLYNLGTIVK